MKKLIFGFATILFLAINTYAQTFFNYVGSTSLCGTNKGKIRMDNASYPLPTNTYFKVINTSTGIVVDSSVATAATPLSNTFDFDISVSGSNLQSGANNLTILGFPSNVAVKVPDNSITVDGILNEPYKLTNTLSFPFACGGCSTNNTSTPGNAINFGLLWDNQNLYIGIKVIDNTPSIASSTSSTSGGIDFNNDGVELYLDPYSWRANYFPGNGGSFNPTIREATVRQIVTGYLASQNSFDYNPDLHSSPGGNLQGIKTATTTFAGFGFNYNRSSVLDKPVQVNGLGYYIEFSIPWSTFFNINTTPGVGFSFGFDLGNNNNYNSTGRLEQTFWGRTTDSQVNDMYSNSSSWGTITLVGSTVNATSAYGGLTLFGNVAPPISGNITFSGTCSTTLNLTAPTQSGSNLFWISNPQTYTTISGASNPLTLNAPITVPSLYLAAYNTAFGCWSAPLEAKIVPQTNTITTVAGQSVSCEIGIPTVSGTPIAPSTWYWQSSDQGTTTGAAYNTTYSLTSTGNAYLRAYNTITGCWSPNSKSIPISVNQAPNPPSNVLIVTNPSTPNFNCFYATLSASGILLPNESYYLQTTISGTNTLMPFSPIATVSTSGTYFGRTQNTITGCWSNQNFSPSSIVAITIPTETPITINGPALISTASQVFSVVSPITSTKYNWYVPSNIELTQINNSNSQVSLRAKTFSTDSLVITVSGTGNCGEGQLYFFKYGYNTITGINNSVSASDIIIFPVPSSKGQKIFISGNALTEIIITDLTGNIISTNSIISSNEFEVEGLNSGMFIAKISYANGTIYKRLIVQ
ncbi:MAG: sugar-binding protein [Bacteroidota bacterium]|nr:sugar-binding protein [Bacteroidota bacterium]